MLTPVILIAYFVTLGPVLSLPIGYSFTQPIIGWVIVPAEPVPREFIEPYRSEWMQKEI